MIDFSEIDYIQYSLGFDSSWKCPLSDYYMSIGYRAFLLRENEVPVSYSIITEKDDNVVILYIFTSKDKRNKGYATCLIKEMKALFNRHFLADSPKNQPCFAALSRCLEKNGFTSFKSARIFQIDLTPESKENYKKHHLNRIPAYLKEKGFECMPFALMPPDIEKQLKESNINEFKNSFDVSRYLDTNEYYLDRNLSMVLVKDGKLRAYILVSRLSKSSIYVEHAAESFQDLGSGIIASPDICFMDAVVNNNDIKTGRYTVSVDNKKSNAFVDSLGMFWHEQITDVVSFAYQNLLVST